MEFMQISFTGKDITVVLESPKPQCRYRVVAYGADDKVLAWVYLRAFGYSQARRQGERQIKWNSGIKAHRFGCYKSGSKKFSEFEVAREAA